jgi:CheY-like chemotaxis protein
MLAVSDTGCGIDAETQKHIFEPFFTTKEQGKGTGLGLSTVYGIIKQSGGHIWLYSEPAQGTVFKVYLPLATETQAETTGVSRPAALPRGTETILIVEDEPQIRKLAFDCLAYCGYDVLSSTNGVEALELIQRLERPIDLVLTDVVMPKLSGRELSERIAAMQPSTKVMFMSGYTNDSVVNHGILDGASWFIQKPFTLESLVRRVRQVLDSDGNPANLTKNIELSGAAAS